jgi:Aminotransferase class I and II
LHSSSKLRDVSYEIRGPVHEHAARLEAEGHRILKLNIGNPAPFGFEAPDVIMRDMIQALPHAQGYSDSKGIQAARRAVCTRYELIDGFPRFDVDDVFLGNGVSELITMTLQALLDTGDQVLIPAPDYPLWTAATSLAGGTPVHYLCDETAGWAPDIADMEAKITDRTKALVVINPNNPTGAVYSREVLEQIVELARKHQLLLLADETYDKILYDDAQHISLASVAPDLLTPALPGLRRDVRVDRCRAAGVRCRRTVSVSGRARILACHIWFGRVGCWGREPDRRAGLWRAGAAHHQPSSRGLRMDRVLHRRHHVGGLGRTCRCQRLGHRHWCGVGPHGCWRTRPAEQGSGHGCVQPEHRPGRRAGQHLLRSGRQHGDGLAAYLPENSQAPLGWLYVGVGVVFAGLLFATVVLQRGKYVCSG